MVSQTAAGVPTLVRQILFTLTVLGLNEISEYKKMIKMYI